MSMKKMMACMARILAGLALALIFVGEQAAADDTHDINIVNSMITHDASCPCGSESPQTFLPETEHKFRINFFDENRAEINSDSLDVEILRMNNSDSAAKLIKTEGAFMWVKLGAGNPDAGGYMMRADVRYGWKGQEKETAFTNWWDYFLKTDFYTVPNSANGGRNVILFPGETKQITVLAKHYTPENPEGEAVDVSQYASWKIGWENNKGALSLSAEGILTANRTGMARCELEWDTESLDRAYSNNITIQYRSAYIYVLRDKEVLSEYAKFTFDIEEYVYAYFKADGIKPYDCYGRSDTGWNLYGHFSLLDMESDFRPVQINEELVPGKIYLVEVGDARRDTNYDRLQYGSGTITYTIEKKDGHEYLPGIVTQKPTMEENGIMTYACMHCNWQRTEEIPKLTELEPPKDGGNTGGGTGSGAGDGTEGKSPDLGDVLETGDGIYQFVDISAEHPSVRYQSSRSSASSVVIPDTVAVNGRIYKVTQIAKNAFQNNTRITRISIGRYVTRIGSGAFYGCKNLKTISGGSNIREIDSRAFAKCKKLIQLGSKKKAVTLPSAAVIGSKAFWGCTSVRTVNITSKFLSAIGASSFQGCTAMTSFSSKSKKLASIGTKVFYGNKKLGRVVLKTTKLTKKTVGKKAFQGIKKTCAFQVPGAKVRTYRQIFQAKGAGKKISVKK